MQPHQFLGSKDVSVAEASLQQMRIKERVSEALTKAQHHAAVPISYPAEDLSPLSPGLGQQQHAYCRAGITSGLLEAFMGTI